MSNLYVLDCTLRDGGYVNNWNFGSNVISNIAQNVNAAAVEFIECGFLSEKKETTENNSIFKTVSDAEKYFNDLNKENLALMVNCGEFDIDNIVPYGSGKIRTIRLAFHKHQIAEAQKLCLAFINNGYNVFLQPMVTMRYTDEEMLELIKWANKNKIEAFYIVDSFGTMRKKDVLRIFYLVDNNLAQGVKIGFHSHNNLQLSFSNALELIALNSKREIIIDTSIFGMGRGAGNLCTELMIQYINENIEYKYNVIPILEAMDEHIMPIFKTYSWGYSVPYYIAAVNDCHPNYATYLSNMQTLCVKDINVIIKMIDPEKKYMFDKEYISQLYLEYQKHQIDDTQTIACIKELCNGHPVLILAPGKSLITNKDDVLKYVEDNHPIVISINHISSIIDCDRIFISNLKRFKGIQDALGQLYDKLICTSNINCNSKANVVNYSSYLAEETAILDNSGIMLLNILKKAGVRKVSLAGYDGFDDNLTENYYDNKMINIIDAEKINEINNSIISYLNRNKEYMEIEFITPSLYEKFI